MIGSTSSLADICYIRHSFNGMNALATANPYATDVVNQQDVRPAQHAPGGVDLLLDL